MANVKKCSPEKSVEILEAIRQNHDTTKMTAEDFEAMAEAILYYGSTCSVEQSVMYVCDEFFPIASL